MPAGRPEPALAAHGLSLRPVADGDESFLRALFHEARAAQFAPLGWSEAALSAFLASQFEFQQRSYDADFPGAERLIVEQDGAPIGRFYVDRRGGGLYLVEITLRADRRGQGFGSLLIEMLQAEARAGLADRVTLNVDVDNAGARRLYARLGFVEAPPTSPYPEISVEMTWRPPVS